MAGVREAALHPLSEHSFLRIREIVHEAIGLSLTENKKSLISSRLSPRIQKLGLRGFEDYIELLARDAQGSESEFQMAVDLLTTNETYFFRERKHYDLLEGELAARRSRGPISLWSAAASFGDEAYSAAMLLSDLQLVGRIGPDWFILATDISHRALLTAKEGIYPAERLREVSEERLRRYCLKGEGPSQGQVMMQASLRERVRLGQLNLCKPFEGIGPFDAVFLRNVLIYFDTPTKHDVVERVAATVRPGGLLFLGTAEGRVVGDTPLLPLIPGVFRKPV